MEHLLSSPHPHPPALHIAQLVYSGSNSSSSFRDCMFACRLGYSVGRYSRLGKQRKTLPLLGSQGNARHSGDSVVV